LTNCILDTASFSFERCISPDCEQRNDRCRPLGKATVVNRRPVLLAQWSEPLKQFTEILGRCGIPLRMAH
jgi:hypothetical protein